MSHASLALVRAYAGLIFILGISSGAQAQETADIDVIPAYPFSAAAVPGDRVQFLYRFNVRRPTATPHKILIHVLRADGSILFGDDQEPGTGNRNRTVGHNEAPLTVRNLPATNRWYGGVHYMHRTQVPFGTPPGRYRVAVGLYDAITGTRLPLKTPKVTAPGQASTVRTAAEDGNTQRHVIGELVVLSDTATRTASIDVLPNWPYAETQNPGKSLTLTYRMKAWTPTSKPMSVLVHFLRGDGSIAFQDDFVPATPTTQWIGATGFNANFTRQITLPADLTSGQYRIAIGLYDATSRLQLKPAIVNPSSYAPTLVEEDNTERRYIVGELNVTRRQIVNAELPCDGVSNVTNALSNALASLSAGQTLLLPAGVCIYSGDPKTGQSRLRLSANNVEVAGRGPTSTVLKSASAKDVNSTAIVVTQSKGVTLRDFAIHGATDHTVTREDAQPGRSGIYVENSDDITIDRFKLKNGAGAGIVLFNATTTTLRKNHIDTTLADGIHITYHSANVTVDSNLVERAGDDSYSVIGYANESPNNNIRFTNNRSYGNGKNAYGPGGSGISVEGSTQVTVSGNYIESSGAAGIRVASIAADSPDGTQTGAVSNTNIVGNTLALVRTTATVGHPAIYVFADNGNVTNTIVSGNALFNAMVDDAIWVRGSKSYRINNAMINKNTIINTTLGVVSSTCVQWGDRLSTTTSLQFDNTFNGTICRAQTSP